MSNDLTSMMLEDSKDLLDNVEVTDIATQCQKLKELQDKIEAQEQIVEALKEKAKILSEKIIPELLAEQGLSSLKLADGSSVTVKREYRCTLPKDEIKKEEAYKWLRENDMGDIIKNNVTVSFGYDEDNKAKQMFDLAVSNGFRPSQKSDVAWNTLTALFEERVKKGLDMPSNVFSTWIKDITKITRK
jgi:hypothetical protein